MPGADEIGWLIEMGPRMWWTAIDVGCGRVWTTDASLAVRFARKVDAERVISSFGPRGIMRGAYATEHVWVASGPPTPAAVEHSP